MPLINHSENRKIAITFRWQPKALPVASERTTMEETVPNRNILVSKFRFSVSIFEFLVYFFLKFRLAVFLSLSFHEFLLNQLLPETRVILFATSVLKKIKAPHIVL